MTPRRWTREKVIEALQAWQTTYGESPTSGDWSAGYLRRLGDPERLACYRRLSVAGLIPTRSTVYRLFGGWDAALAAAGLRPRPALPPSPRCSKGHDDWVTGSDGRRFCRTCRNDAGRRRREGKERGLLLGYPVRAKVPARGADTTRPGASDAARVPPPRFSPVPGGRAHHRPPGA